MARVAFIQDIMVESIGYMSMAAVLKAQGHTVDVFYCDPFNQHVTLGEVQRFQPDIVGFSVLTPSVSFLLGIAHKVKQRTRALTIFGNIHTLLCPEIIEKPCVDMVCLWEGETVLSQVCAQLDAKMPYQHIKGLWAKENGQIIKNEMPADLVDLDALPFYDRDMYDKYSFFRHSEYLRISLGRGCPASCAFCHSSFLRQHYGGGRYVRKMSPERAIEEIRYQVKRRKKVKFIFFTDEVFWISKDWLRRFLKMYQENFAIPFSANFHFTSIEESDIKLFAEARVNNLIFAVESGDERVRSSLLHKYVKDRDIFKVAEWMRAQRIAYVSSAMFGLPQMSFDAHVAQVDFYRRLKPAYVWTVFFQAYPGLELTQHPDIRLQAINQKEFAPTVHHDMSVKGKDAYQLENLKKVYFLCIAFPWMSGFLISLSKLRLPIIFDLLFMIHFSYYIYRFERVSFFQFLIHVKVFGINPLLCKMRTFFLSKKYHDQEMPYDK